MMHFDFADRTITKEKVDFDLQHAGITTTGYRARVAAGDEPTEAEIAALASLLRGLVPTITEDVPREVYDIRSARLLHLLRHVFGLERIPSWPEAVTAASDGFIARHTTLTELQLRFRSTLSTFLLQNRRPAGASSCTFTGSRKCWKSLRQAAIVESSESSNRLEGNTVPRERFEALVLRPRLARFENFVIPETYNQRLRAR